MRKEAGNPLVEAKSLGRKRGDEKRQKGEKGKCKRISVTRLSDKI